MSLVLGLISLLVFFIRLNQFPLKNWDEAWYAEIIKNLASGRYGFLVPYWNGQYYFDKPPLYFWLSYPLVKLFGVGEWQVRLVSVVAASLCVAFVYLIGKKLFSQRIGLLAGLIFVSISPVILRFQEGGLDSLLIFLFLASYYFFLNSNRQKSHLIFSGLALGLGLLVKSWLLGLFPLLFMVSYSFFLNRKLAKNVFFILIIALIASSWWYVLGWRHFGNSFIDWYLLHPGAGNFGLYPLRFEIIYLKTILSDIGLWLIPLIFIRPHLHPRFISFFPPLLLYFIILHLSADKLGWYLLPLYPFIALALAAVLIKVPKTFIIIVFIGQIILTANLFYRDQDRSLIGATLGKTIKNKIPPGEMVILDDHDFSSFLYYSDLSQIFTTQKNSAKPNEYWILSQTEVERLIRESKNTSWVVTPDLSKFLYLKPEISFLPYQYYLLRLDINP